MKVYLVGYMGVGKSTLGKKLARHLNITFLDLDELIESDLGMRIPEVFRQKGENFFRAREQEILENQVRSKASFVLATGGGAVLAEETMTRLKESGVVVWLKMSPKMLASRLEQSKGSRPLLEGVTNYETFITSHLRERIPYYSLAQIHFAASQNSTEQIKLLAEEIKNYSR